MEIFPRTTVQTLADCEPGQLVRSLGYGEADRLGVVFDLAEVGETRRGIVRLTSTPPVMEIDNPPEQTKVLAYVGKTVWKVDQNGPMETNARDLYDKSGVVIRNAETWLLNVTSPRNRDLSYAGFQLNLMTGEMTRYQEEFRGVAFFGAWSVFLEDEDRPFEDRWEIASYCFEQVERSN